MRIKIDGPVFDGMSTLAPCGNATVCLNVDLFRIWPDGNQIKSPGYNVGQKTQHVYSEIGVGVSVGEYATYAMGYQVDRFFNYPVICWIAQSFRLASWRQHEITLITCRME